MIKLYVQRKQSGRVVAVTGKSSLYMFDAKLIKIKIPPMGCRHFFEIGTIESIGYRIYRRYTRYSLHRRYSL